MFHDHGLRCGDKLERISCTAAGLTSMQLCAKTYSMCTGGSGVACFKGYLGGFTDTKASHDSGEKREMPGQMKHAKELLTVRTERTRFCTSDNITS